MEETRAKIGERVRALRQRSGLTQERVAELGSFHPTYVAKVESGLVLPSLRALVRLAEALGVTVSDIVGVLDEPPPTPSSADKDRVVAEMVGLLRDCGPAQLAFIRDLVEVVKRHLA